MLTTPAAAHCVCARACVRGRSGLPGALGAPPAAPATLRMSITRAFEACQNRGALSPRDALVLTENTADAEALAAIGAYLHATFRLYAALGVPSDDPSADRLPTLEAAPFEAAVGGLPAEWGVDAAEASEAFVGMGGFAVGAAGATHEAARPSPEPASQIPARILRCSVVTAERAAASCACAACRWARSRRRTRCTGWR